MAPSRTPIVTSVAAVAAVSLLAAGCGGGGGGSPHVASVTTSTGAAPTTGASVTSGQPSAVAYAVCVRSHGVPGWPDPQSNGQFDKSKLRALSVSKARLRAATTACERLLPPQRGGSRLTPAQQRTQLADERSFARCMRSRGVARFPDPNQQDQLSVAMVEAQGIDVHSPAFLRVVQACLPASHGALTAADVRRAIAEAGS